MFDQAPLSGDRTPPPVDADPERAVAFLLELAQALHAYGASAHRLEAMLTLVARRLGLTAHFYSTPTAVLVSIGPQGSERTSLLRVVPGEVNLEKLASLQETTVRVIRGHLDCERGRARVREIVEAPPRYGTALTIACSALSSASAAVFFGGRTVEQVASFVVGAVVGSIVHVSRRWTSGFSVNEPIAAAFAAVAAGLAARLLGPISTVTVTLAGIVTLLPGLSVTTAMTELSTKNLASGTARFAGAIVQLVGLGFGVALGSRLVAQLVPAGPPLAPPPPPSPVLLLVSVVTASLAAGILLKAHPRDLSWIVLSGGLAFGGARLGADFVGAELGAFVGALLIGLASNAYARAYDRPSAVPLVPGLLVLVPGSIGFHSVFSLLEQDVVSGVNAAFTMVLVATAIGAGILLASIALPTRRAL